MGWSYGLNSDGREVGYSVDATCDADSCDTEIDRGLASVCGPMHGGGEDGCGGYFCASHLVVGMGASQLCDACADALGDEEDE